MKDITNTFGTLYHPVKAFVVYQQDTADKNFYVEAYDMDKNGFPINAHPLTLRESTKFANALDTSEVYSRKFLKPLGLLPKNVLYLNTDRDGFVLWYTPAQKVDMFFVENLGIPNGTAALPPLLWKASKNTLWIFAMGGQGEINQQTELYCAPFFNLYADGRVCMGTVAVNIKADCPLEEFIALWERYFFKSYFSHLITNKSPVKGNIIQLWKSLVGSRKKFPIKSLLKNGLTIKKLLL